MRMKGILNLRKDPDQFVFQGVHMLFEGRPGRAWADEEERLNRLVFIGRNLDKEKITQGFLNCITTGNGRLLFGGSRPFRPQARRFQFYPRSNPLLGANDLDLPGRTHRSSSKKFRA